MSPGELRNDGSRRHRPSAISVIYSDDHGKSWKTGEVIFEDGDMVNGEEVINPSESTVIQLDDGSVMINTRNESEIHRRLTAVSENVMDDWKNKQFHSQLLEPICMGSMVRLTEGETFDKTRMLFVNPNNLFDNDGGKNKIRQNITIKLSYDEGKNWPVSKVIEPGLSGYPDISVGPDHMIYLIYENGGINENHYDPEHLTFMRLNLEWLTENADSVN
jgi:sialidase-1